MDDKKIIETLLRLLKKEILDDGEKEAIHSAIGILSWTKLAQSRLKGKKAKKDKDDELSISDSVFPGRKPRRRP